MNTKQINRSAEVIADGKQDLKALQEALFLHNYWEHYQGINDTEFSDIDISLMDEIMVNLIRAQEMREEKAYKLLGINDGITGLNRLYKEGFDDRAFIDSTINSMITQAVEQSKNDFMNGPATAENIQRFVSTFQTEVNEAIATSYKTKPEVAAMLQMHFGAELAERLTKIDPDLAQLKTMKECQTKLTNALKTFWREATLEYSDVAVWTQLFTDKNFNGKVVHSGRERNDNSKQIKADLRFVFNVKGKEYKIGFSDKNYALDLESNLKGGMVTLHSAHTLEHFYNLVKNAKFANTGKRAIMDIMKNFQKPDFKYHLVNQACFQGGEYVESTGARHIEETQPGANVLRFIKAMIPLHIGSQIDIAGDDTNVDFVNISGQLIPVSSILKSIFGQTGAASAQVNLYSNYKPQTQTMLHKKWETPIKGPSDYYSDTAIKAGGQEGTNLYNAIKIGSMHLKIALAQFR